MPKKQNSSNISLMLGTKEPSASELANSQWAKRAQRRKARGTYIALSVCVPACVCVCVCHVLEEIDWRFICEIEIESVTNARANQLVCKNGICFFVFHLIFCFDSRVQNVEWCVLRNANHGKKIVCCCAYACVCAFGNMYFICMSVLLEPFSPLPDFMSSHVHWKSECESIIYLFSVNVFKKARVARDMCVCTDRRVQWLSIWC